MNEAILKVKNLAVGFDGSDVIKDLDFSINKGDVVAIVGPNGAGKSVLFRALLGLVPHSGQIEWARDLKISYVPQKFAIDRELPLSVEEFLKFKKKNISEIVDTLNSLGIMAVKQQHHSEYHLQEHILKQRLGWLSGGQLQRVLIAWALLDNPDVLLFDEPTAGIDVGGEETIYNLLKKLHSERGLTMLLISHDLNIVYKYANNVICLNKQQICFGEPHTVLNPNELSALYGGDAQFYHHEHKSNE